MSDYFISVRNVRRGAFGNDPGPTRFLEIPSTDTIPTPAHRIRESVWVERVKAEAEKNLELEASTGELEGNILFWVHGYNNSTATVLARHRHLQQGLNDQGFKGVVVSFDWPSEQSAASYLEDRHDAKLSSMRLVNDGIRILCREQTNGCRILIHLLGHSMGAFVIREAFDDADDVPDIAGTNWRVSQVCFIAADISSNSMRLGNAKSQSLYLHSAKVTNYNNPFDTVLKISNAKRIGVAPRLGRVGLPDLTPPLAVNVDCGAYFDTLEPPANDPLGTFSHTWYIGNPLFHQDLVCTLRADSEEHCFPTRQIVVENRFVLKQPE